MLLGARLWMSGGGGSPLPYDAEVDYIQGDGSAYILEESIVISGSASVEIELSVESYTQINDVFGMFVSAKKSSAIYVSATQVLTVRYNSYTRASTTTSSDSIYKVSCDSSGSKIYQGDSLISSGSAVTSWTTPLCLFATVSSSASPYSIGRNPSYAKIYSCKITASGAEVDLIPVRVGQVGYMYDRVSGELFGNSGTGAFIIGPDK